MADYTCATRWRNEAQRFDVHPGRCMFLALFLTVAVTRLPSKVAVIGIACYLRPGLSSKMCVVQIMRGPGHPGQTQA